MGENIEGTLHTIKVITVGARGDDVFVKVNSVEDLLAQVGGAGKQVTAKGKNLATEGVPIEEIKTVTVAPVAVKQG